MEAYKNLSQEEKALLVQKAYDRAYYYEKNFGNCPQCTMAGISDVFPELGISDEIFQCGFGLGGGCGCYTKGTCGAVNGAAMVVSHLMGRRRDNMEGFTPECTDAVRRIITQFDRLYDGVRCCDVQTHLFGESFDLSTKEGNDAYFAAGGHDRCAEVVGTVAKLFAELLVEGDIQKK